MKIIIGVFDRQISRDLAIEFSGRKFLPIEAESIEEIPKIAMRHENAIILCEDISPELYHNIKSVSPYSEMFLLAHSNLNSEHIHLLRSCGLRGLIPYSENAKNIAETLLKYLSMMASAIKKEEKTHIPLAVAHKDVGILLPSEKSWIYGTLAGFNSSKAVVSFDNPEAQQRIAQAPCHNILVYLQGLKIQAHAETVYHKRNIFVFRYCSMNQESQNRLAHYLYYCNKTESTQTTV